MKTIHWQELPQKPITFHHGYQQRQRVLLVGDYWNPAAGELAIEGLKDISDTDDGKAFLSSNLAKEPPPVLRVYSIDEPFDGPDGFFLLQEYEGDIILGRVGRRDLISAANETG